MTRMPAASCQFLGVPSSLASSKLLPVVLIDFADLPAFRVAAFTLLRHMHAVEEVRIDCRANRLFALAAASLLPALHFDARSALTIRLVAFFG